VSPSPETAPARQSTIRKDGISLITWAMMIALSLIWGGSFLFGRVAVGSIAPFTLVTIRVLLGTLTLALILVLTRTPFPKGKEIWLALLGMGLINNAIPFSLIIYGQRDIGAGLASILNAMTPLFTVLVAHGLTEDEKLNASKIFGVLLGLAGVAVLLGPAVQEGHPFAILSCVTAALSYGFGSVWGRRFKRLQLSALQTAFGQVSSATLMMIPLALLLDRAWEQPMPTIEAVQAVIALGILCTGFAYILFFRILANAGATAVSLVTFLIPPSAIVLGALVLHESLTPLQWLGMALIGLGLAAVDGRLLQILSARQP
jgi:drug/metabolite transporter (DMT)-like permease